MKLFSIFFFILFTNFFIFSQESTHKKKLKKESIKKNIYKESIPFYIKTNNNKKIIILLKKNPCYIQKYSKELQVYALKTKNSMIRRYLIDCYLLKLKKNKKIKLDINKENHPPYLFIKKEFNYLKKNINTSKKEIEYLNKLIVFVRTYQEKYFFYEILTFIGYPLMSVRIETFKTLGVLKDDRMFPVLLQWTYSKNPIERTYAIDALAYIKDDRMVNILIKLLKDEHKSVRLYAINSLYKLKRTEAIYHFIKIVQSDVNTEVRIKAIKVLGNYQAYNAFFILLKTLTDSKSIIRKNALEAVLKYKNSKACYYISQQLYRETKDELKILFIKSLVQLKNAGGMTGLVKILEKEKNIHVKLWGIYALSKLKDYRGFNPVLQNLNSKTNIIRTEACFTLGVIKNKKATPYLLKILKSKKETYFVQSAALDALEKINDEKVLPILFDLSEKHSNLYFRQQIKKTLKIILYKKYPNYVH